MPSTLLRAACFAALYFAAAQVGLAFRTESERLAVIWPPNGLLLGTLLIADRRDRRLAVVAAAVACLVANLTGGNTFLVSLGFTVVNVSEPCLAAWLLRPGDGPFALARPREVFRLFLVAFLTSLASALPGAAVVTLGLGAPSYLDVLVTFWLSDAMAAVVVTPFVLAWAGRGRDGPGGRPARRTAEAAALFASLGGLAAVMFAQPPQAGHYLLAYVFPLFPLFVWAGLRFGEHGSATAVLAVALIAVWNTGHGRGPFVEPGVRPAAALLMLQFFLATLSLTSLALAASQAERDAIERALRDGEERHRQVTETIQEVFWLAAPDGGRVLYVSPQYERVWGRSCASLYADPGGLTAACHPDDRARLPPAPADRPTDEQYRVVRPDGSVRWVRARTFPVRDAAGRVCRVVGLAQDVTDARHAEQAQAALIDRLQKALAEIKALRGLIPVCAWCKSVRDDAGFWSTVETYLSQHTAASVTHGICPGCLEALARQLPSGADPDDAR